MQRKPDFIYKYISRTTAYPTETFHVVLKFYPKNASLTKTRPRKMP